MVKENTIGVIVFRREGKGIRYLLLHQEGEYWAFPKGWPEKDEKEIETALRELEEETGITDINIIDDFCYEFDYDFDTEIKDGIKEKIYKHAILFLGEVKDDKVKISDEHLDFGWFDFKTALKRAFYQEGQDAIKHAHQFLLKQQDFVL